MSRSFNKKYFGTLIDVTALILRFLIIGFYILIGFLFLAGVSVSFIPKELLDYDMANLENIDVQIKNVMYDIDPSLFTGVINVKWVLVLGAFTGIVNVVFMQFILLQLKKVITDVKAKEPFSVSNIKRITHIGYAYVVSAFVLPFVNGLFMFRAINLIIETNANINFMVHWQSIFMGALLVILANIFDYGSYLQEEYDMTV